MKKIYSKTCYLEILKYQARRVNSGSFQREKRRRTGGHIQRKNNQKGRISIHSKARICAHVKTVFTF